MLPRVHKWADVEDDCPVLVKRARDSVTIDLEDVKVSEVSDSYSLEVFCICQCST